MVLLCYWLSCLTEDILHNAGNPNHYWWVTLIGVTAWWSFTTTECSSCWRFSSAQSTSWNKTKREKSLINIFYNLHHRHKLKNKEMYLLDWMSECLAHWKAKTDRMAQLVEGQTEKPGAILMICVWFPSGSVTRDLLPKSTFSADSYSVCTTPLCNAC